MLFLGLDLETIGGLVTPKVIIGQQKIINAFIKFELTLSDFFTEERIVIRAWLLAATNSFAILRKSYNC